MKSILRGYFFVFSMLILILLSSCDSGNLQQDDEPEDAPEQIDTIPPGEAAAFTAVPDNGQISLSWENPRDEDFAGVNIMWKISSYPVDSKDGSEAYNGKDSTYLHQSLKNGADYCYTIFTYDNAGNYSEGVRAECIPFKGDPGGPWTKSSNNPIIDIGETGDFDEVHATKPMVLPETTGSFRMYYLGHGNGSYNKRLGLAFSNDGKTWEKSDDNPIYGATSEYGSMRGIGSVIKDNDGYKMYYWRYPAEQTGNYIYAATSADGISWTEYKGAGSYGSIVAGYGGDFSYTMHVEFPVVIYDEEENKYKMWYAQSPDSSYSWRIDYATSSNGLYWYKYNSNPVLTLSAGGWDSQYVIPTCVIKNDVNDYRLWYYSSGASGIGIGTAYSEDGISWTKSSDNPILQPGTENSWDNSSLSGAWVADIGGPYILYYNGNDGTANRIGFAEQ